MKIFARLFGMSKSRKSGLTARRASRRQAQSSFSREQMMGMARYSTGSVKVI